ncbi:MAG: 50S ribosomal protein L35 [Actinobacteria bacterium]|nr:50S ribosomal protein L35 [Actinomycetota bacterium]
MKKNKIKTKKAAAKRFKLTGTGKVRRYKTGMRHLLEHKSKDTKRQSKNSTEVSSSDIRKVSRMLPGLKRS